MSNDNVTPIRKDIPNLPEFKLHSREYTGPADAVRDVLNHNGFDDNVKNEGWVELRIVAQFSDVGAMFHTVQARRVEMHQVDRPAFTLLKMVAVVDKKPEDHYIKKATIAELETLDRELANATIDHLAIIASVGPETEDLMRELGMKETAKILLDITERPEENA